MWYLVLYGVFALWVLFDSIDRKLGGVSVLWTLGTLLLGPLVLPIYMAKRPLKNGEVREGGTGWNVLKNFAIFWTVLMAIVGVYTMVKVSAVASALDNGSDAAKAGAGIGILLGMGFLAVVWFLPTVGVAVLGFLLKKNSIIEKGPTGPLVGQGSSVGLANGWVGLAACTVVGLILVVVTARTVGKDSPTTTASEATSEAATKPTWQVREKTDPMDGTKETSLLLQSPDRVKGIVGSSPAFLFVRCTKGKIAAYVSVGGPLESEYGKDDYGVRTKFDDDAAEQGRWDASTDGQALFAPNPGALVKHLEGSKVFLFQFTPFQQRPMTLRFDVSGLREKLEPISDACGLV
jgi:hypothetical protein